MRDILVVGIVLIGALVALRRPWIGVLLWTWLSLMNPHRYTYGFAYDFPVAAIAAASVLVGILMTTSRVSPFKYGGPSIWLGVFMVWITLSWRLGLDPQGDYEQWDKVMKILLMVLVAVMVVRSKEQIIAVTWVVTGSLALLGIKGGIFTIANGGNYRVWGPSGSFIEENNAMALALVMTIPLLRFFHMQVQNKLGSRLLLLSMVLLAASALGSHSRGGLVAIAAMTVLMWVRGGCRLSTGLLLGIVGIGLVAFMPEHWTARMSTIEEYDTDDSSMGRIAAWWTAWNAAFSHPFGVGFNAARPDLFLTFSPYQLQYGTPVAHSIYFQILGHHGFIGLFIWLGMWVSTWRIATAIRRASTAQPELKWCGDLAAMLQVSMFGYFVGGAFLNLAYFDLPYNSLVILVLVWAWIKRKAWLTEPTPVRPFWLRVPGLQGLAR
ncbi:MAG: putative O-glycosylation ligase, exosortase A system-associated [Aquabacterium sp.]|nr:putative O-glycosylation ligase, exosortase A system-associated [Aquabacterium sp.]